MKKPFIAHGCPVMVCHDTDDSLQVLGRYQESIPGWLQLGEAHTKGEVGLWHAIPAPGIVFMPTDKVSLVQVISESDFASLTQKEDCGV